MLPADKKKRTHSGSRSVPLPNNRNHANIEDISIPSMSGTNTRNMQTTPRSKPKIAAASTALDPPAKTQQNKKNIRTHPSTQQIQQQRFQSISSSTQDPASHSVSADRRRSVINVNRTQPNFQPQDFDPAIDQLILGLRSIPQPPCLNTKLMNKYFSDMRRFFSSLDSPFNRLCLQLHTFYVNPMQKFLELVSPMQQAIRRKQEVSKEIDRQIIQNQQLYSKLQPIDIEIFKLKQKIEDNRVLIEQKRQEKQQRSRGKQNQSLSQHSQAEEPSPSPSPSPKHEPEQQFARAEPVGRGFRLDLNNIGKLGNMGYHQQFYSKMDEFSQSWRDQAMREKRF